MAPCINDKFEYIDIYSIHEYNTTLCTSDLILGVQNASLQWEYVCLGSCYSCFSVFGKMAVHTQPLCSSLLFCTYYL
jgi:hypothetical protein